MIESEARCQFNPGSFSFPKQKKTCPECNSSKLVKDYSRAELICDNCGLVLSENILDSSEKGLSNSEIAEGRSQTMLLHHDRGLSTSIGKENKDANGRDLEPEKIAEIYRLRKWDKRFKITNARDRNLSFALSELTTIGSQLSLPKSVIETASIIYRHALEKNLVLGRSIECVSRACLYIACRQTKSPNCLDDLILSSDYLDKKDISKAYRMIMRELGLRISLMGPSDYLPKVSGKLNLPFNVTRRANELVGEIAKKGLTSGRNPLSICAAAIYISCLIEKHPIKQKDIATASNVTDMTLRARYQEILEKLEIRI